MEPEPRRDEATTENHTPQAVAVVAGATGKLGSAIAARLSAEGHAVVAIGRGETTGDAPADAERCRADITQDASIAVVHEAIAGRPVRLVVNAAGASRRAGVGQVSPSAITALVDLKVCGLLRLVRAADPSLHEGSRLIALGGRLGFDADHRAAAAGIANAAVANLVRQLGQLYGPRGVTAHVLAPGPIDDSDPGRGAPATLLGGDASRETPLGRLATPPDVAWAVSMLLEPGAALLNGGSLILDGGRRTSSP